MPAHRPRTVIPRRSVGQASTPAAGLQSRLCGFSTVRGLSTPVSLRFPVCRPDGESGGDSPESGDE
jgi:hypothetical protein